VRVLGLPPSSPHPRSHPRSLAIRELDASCLEGAAHVSDPVDRDLPPGPFEIHNGGKAKISGLHEIGLRPIQKPARGAALGRCHISNQ
jgi:hypothetical protein